MSQLTIYRDQIIAFQKEILSTLIKESYASLEKKPRSTRISVPSELSQFEAYVNKKPGDGGGVEITVQVAKRILWLFLEGRATGFEVFPDGKVVLFDTSVDETD
jgi:hypothetical protein